VPRVRSASGDLSSLLLERPDGRPLPSHELQNALKQACRGLVFAEPMTSHRLRHTYATSLLTAGVSLPVLMKLLGHRDYHMTLRYAALTIETVATEYASAVSQLEDRYKLHAATATKQVPTSLADLARYLLKEAEDAGLDKQHARNVVHRLQRLDRVVQRLLQDCPKIGRSN
jgi:hypothetical protein